MRFEHVRMIAAVGESGQIGLKGVLPWHNSRDLEHFRKITEGGVCVVGARTAATLPPLPGRHVHIWKRGENPTLFARAHSRDQIWIIGGRTIYRIWRPYAWQTILTHIDYDGPADAYMPSLWQDRLGL